MDSKRVLSNEELEGISGGMEDGSAANDNKGMLDNLIEKFKGQGVPGNELNGTSRNKDGVVLLEVNSGKDRPGLC